VPYYGGALLILKTEWMDVFAYACYEANKTLVDINDQWRPYIPTWYPMPTGTTTGSSSPTVGASTAATVITGLPTTFLSEGSIAGITVGAIGAVTIMAICGFFFWRNKKKLKRKSREVAQMADALQQDGVQRRIDELRYHSSSHDSLTAVPKSPVNPDPYDHYNPTTRNKEYYKPQPSGDGLSTKGITASPPNPYAHYNLSVEDECDIGRSTSQCSPGMTAVTTSQGQMCFQTLDSRAARPRSLTNDKYGQKMTHP
jgi:hypothetical protein